MTSLQFGAAIATHLFPQIGAPGASALRLGLSAVLLAAIGRPQLASWTREQREGVVLLGLTMAVMNTAFYEAVARLSDKDAWGRFRIAGTGTPPF